MTDVHPSGPDLGAYALGALTPEETAALLEHLRRCPSCPQELAELTAAVGALGEVPPEFFLDGPPEDDLLLQRTLRATRGERAGGGSAGRRAVLVAAAAAAGLVLLGSGVLAGRQLAPVSAPTPTAPAPSTPVPGTRTAEATDASTGASLNVTIVPAAGWVRVSATVRGVPAGEKCRLVVVGRGSQRETAGSWLVSPKAAQDGTALTGFALVDPAQVSAVTVETVAGKRFVSVPIT